MEVKHNLSTLCFIVSRKVKSQLKLKITLYSLWRGNCDWLNVSKVIWEVSAAGYFLLDGVPWSGKAVEVDRDQIKTLTEDNQHYNMQKISNIFKISKPKHWKSFAQLIYVHHLDVWVPDKLSKKTKNKNKNTPFLTVFPQVIIY